MQNVSPGHTNNHFAILSIILAELKAGGPNISEMLMNCEWFSFADWNVMKFNWHSTWWKHCNPNIDPISLIWPLLLWIQLFVWHHQPRSYIRKLGSSKNTGGAKHFKVSSFLKPRMCTHVLRRSSSRGERRLMEGLQKRQSLWLELSLGAVNSASEAGTHMLQRTLLPNSWNKTLIVTSEGIFHYCQQ